MPKRKHDAEEDNVEVGQKEITDIEIYKDPDSNLYLCSLCQRSYQKRSHLKLHMHYHRKEKPNEYFNIITINEDPFKCKNCELHFKTEEELEIHELHSHAVKCDKCNRTYPLSEIEKHYRLHSLKLSQTLLESLTE